MWWTIAKAMCPAISNPKINRLITQSEKGKIMFEINEMEVQMVAGGVIASAWVDGDYWVRYDDGKVQRFESDGGVRF
jgi:hypothetical protein